MKESELESMPSSEDSKCEGRVKRWFAMAGAQGMFKGQQEWRLERSEGQFMKDHDAGQRN